MRDTWLARYIDWGLGRPRRRLSSFAVLFPVGVACIAPLDAVFAWGWAGVPWTLLGFFGVAIIFDLMRQAKEALEDE